MSFYDDLDRDPKEPKEIAQDTIEIMRSKTGRRFVWRLLLNMGLFAMDSPNNRAEAVSLWSQLEAYCVDLRKQMVLENMDG